MKIFFLTYGNPRYKVCIVPMMIGMQLVTEFIKTVILTGWLENDGLAPVSTLLISPPEHGKTSLVLEHSCKSVFALSDVTGTGLKKIVTEMTDVTHIAVLDLAIVTSHKNQVSNYLYANMNAIAEEGFIAEATPAGVRKHEQPMKRGLICCMTPEMCRDGRQLWNKLGFTSRMLPFNYKFNEKQRAAIRKNIIHRKDKKKPARIILDLRNFETPQSHVYVKMTIATRKKISHLAAKKSEELGVKVDPNGFRRLKQYLAIAAAHALSRNYKNPIVTQRDIDFLQKISPYINYKKGVEL